MRKVLFLFATVLLMMMACGNGSDNGKQGADNPLKSIKLTEGETRVASANADFAFRLLKSANTTLAGAKTLALSPLSASLALSMVTNGAGGDTQAELLQALGMEGCDMATVNACNEKLVGELATLDNTSTVKMANSLWLNKGFPVLESFKKAVTDSYDAQVEEVDMATALPAIQEWCSEKTDGLIQNFPPAIGQDTKTALLNALYFKGAWSSPFEKAKTKKDTFTNSDGTTTEASFMCDERNVRYGSEEGFSWVELPYGNGAFSLRVVLPDEGVSVEQCIDSLCGYSWNGGAYRDVNLKLPKFSLNETCGLVEVLQGMGVDDAFTDGADFTNLSSNGLKISEVKQATAFAIDEDGVEAAAATYVGLVETSLMPSPDIVVDFHVQRPFVFLLSEKSTGCVLFIGKIEKL